MDAKKKTRLGSSVFNSRWACLRDETVFGKGSVYHGDETVFLKGSAYLRDKTVFIMGSAHSGMRPYL